MKRILSLASALALATPASAQVFWQSPNFTGAPIVPGEAGIGVALPGATPEEYNANVAWQMRAALNVAALQCNWDQTLLSRDIYNGVLVNHREELARVYATLGNYFRRTSPTARAGQDALDRFGTRTYASVSAVQGISTFCETASRVGKSVLIAPRGSFTAVAIERLREVRNAIAGGREQQFTRPFVQARAPLPDLSDRCWNRRNQYNFKRCGAYTL